jgi:pyruvate/2-oxoglutarate dehydrogenase complex dihydrolipoamide dehydrogenase (E3) component
MTAITPLIHSQDHYNRLLLSHVRPESWANPRPAGKYNLVVIGAGTAGLVSAAGASGLGAKVALIERNLMGGDCLNFGCVPSKALIRASSVRNEIGSAARFGINQSGACTVDFERVMERIRRLRSEISHHDSVQRFQQLGIDVFLGEGRFAGRNKIEVEGKLLKFSKAVIATGARPAVPKIPGLTEAGFLNNETIFDLTTQPASMAIIGGGPIGCELAQAFARLGTRVTIIEINQQLLPREDPEAVEILKDSLERDKIDVRLGSRVTEVILSRPGVRKLMITSNEKKESLEVDQIFVGVGRIPNVENLGLESAGIDFDRRGIRVDDHLRTTNPSVFAAGDISLSNKFTHAADAAARIVIQNALFKGRKKVSRLMIPRCTYTSPEIAHVGLTVEEAREKGVRSNSFQTKFSDVDRAVLDGAKEGFVKIHVKKGTDRIIGATIVGRDAGNLISEITSAMVGGIGLGKMAEVIHPYPTTAEAIKKTADAFNRTRLTPRVKWVFDRWLSWSR